MTDSRCANAEHQLRVDVMMLEYVLYKTVKAQLEGLEWRMRPSNDLRSHVTLDIDNSPIVEARRLLDIFDTLIKLFRRQHGIEKLSEAARIDTDVLGFLVLLNMWLDEYYNRHHCLYPGLDLEIPPATASSLCVEQWLNQFFRFRWLRTREGSASRDDLPSQSGQFAHSLNKPKLALSHHVLPKFLHLCIRIQPPDCNLSPKWIKLVCSLMVQAAIEILIDPTLFDLDAKHITAALEACCAWGFISRKNYAGNSSLTHHLLSQLEAEDSGLDRRQIEQLVRQKLEQEDEIRDMFYSHDRRESTAEAKSLPLPFHELLTWTKARQETLDLILETFNAIQDDPDDADRLPIEYLRKQYNLATSIRDVHKFLVSSWQRLHSPLWAGKPTLVQLEGGSLKGLTNGEFESFSVRAGIEHDRSLGS